MLCTVFDHVADKMVQIELDPSALSFEDSKLWPEEGGITLLFVGGKDGNDDLGEYFKNLDLEDVDDLYSPTADLEDQCPVWGYDKQSILQDNSAMREPWMEYLEGQQQVAVACVAATSMTIKALENSGRHLYMWKASSILDLKTQFAGKIYKKPYDFNDQDFFAFLNKAYGENADLGEAAEYAAIIIPSRSFIQKAADHGIPIDIGYGEVSLCHDEGSPKHVLDALMTSRLDDFEEYLRDANRAIDWVEKANLDLGGMPTQEMCKAQMELELV